MSKHISNNVFLPNVLTAIDGTKVTVNFPEQLSWTGIVSEMEAVP